MADFNFTQTGQELQSDINLVENGIGDAFSSSQTYAVGDYVIYNDKLWKCSTAVSSAGAWTGITNWTETKITDELSNAGIGGGGGSGINGYTLTYDMAQGIPTGLLFLKYLYIDINGNFKNGEISSDGTHKSGTLTNVLMVYYNSTGTYNASLSNGNFPVCVNINSQEYTEWLTDNCEYNAYTGGGGGN